MQNPNSPGGLPADHDSSAKPLDSDQALSAVWLAGLLLAMVLVGIGVFALLTLSSNLLGQAAPTPTRPAVAAASPTASPMVTQSPPTTTPSIPTPTPPPTPSPPTLPEPAFRFVRLIEDPDLSLHLETEASVQAGPASITVSMTLDQSGRDMAIDMTTSMTGEESNLQTVVKDGTAYFREDRGAWFATDDLSLIDLPATSLAFSQLRPQGTEYLGVEDVGDRTLHHLRVPSVVAAGVDPTALQRFGCDTDNLAMDLWVRDDGTPVTGSFEYSCIVRSAGGPANLTASANYDFSKVGRPINIKPPKRFRRL
jgi:hypothetical protein